MKSAWRLRLSKRSTLVLCSLSIFCGCQAGAPSNWGVPAGSRVPPPPTGSYQHQGAYYNNPATGVSASPPAGGTVSGVSTTTGTTTGSTTAPNQTASQNTQTAFGAAPVVQASAVAPYNSVNPGTQISSNGNNDFSAGMPATSVGFPSTAGQVSTAGYTDNGSGMAEVVTANSLQAQPDIDPQLQSGGVQITGSPNGANLQWK